MKGYIYFRLQPSDFFYNMTDGRGYISEHRLVVAQHLKRCLLPWEIVHHKNGNKEDNHVENLMLLPHAIHHVSDAVLKAKLTRAGIRIRRQVTEIKRLKELLHARYCPMCQNNPTLP